MLPELCYLGLAEGLILQTQYVVVNTTRAIFRGSILSILFLLVMHAHSLLQGHELLTEKPEAGVLDPVLALL